MRAGTTDPSRSVATDSRRRWVAFTVAACLVAIGAIALIAIDLPGPATTREWLTAGGPERWAAAVVGLSLALMTPMSRTALSVLVGAVAGFAAGLAIALTAGLLAGVSGFWLSRRLGRGAVTRWAGHRLAGVDGWIRDRDLVAVLIARLTPVAPFAVVTYAAGLSAVRFGPYLLATAIGLVPWSVLYVGMGASAASVGAWAGQLDRLLLVAASATALVLLGWIARRARRSTTARGAPQPSEAQSAANS